MLGSRERKPPSYIYDMKYKYLSCDSLNIYFLLILISLIDSLIFIFYFKIKQEIKLVGVKLVKINQKSYILCDKLAIAIFNPFGSLFVC